MFNLILGNLRDFSISIMKKIFPNKTDSKLKEQKAMDKRADQRT